MYPAKPEHMPESDKWTWDALLPVAEACKKANMTVAIGLGQTPEFRGHRRVPVPRL